MCHESVLMYVSMAVDAYGLAEKSCLDVGSLDVNGSVRDYFKGEYVGIDIREGKNVDLVLSAHDIVSHFGEERFDVVVCCEMMEHDRKFWVTMEQFGKVLKPGGRLILTTRGIGFPLHEYPWDLWRFTEEAGKILGELAGLRDVTVRSDPQAPGIFLTGVR
jgi:SAM-dependent methyltransferase